MLHVHRGERTDALAEALADVLADPLDDPFVPEVVAVPTRGVERWLAQRLSHRLGTSDGRGDGICANVVFPSPADLVATALGRDGEHPWRPERLVWPLLEVIDACAGESWCAPLGTYLGVDDPSGLRDGRRVAVARHLARLATAYGEHRPELVRAWAAKDDDATPDDLRWQAELWRRLRERVGVPSPAESLEDDCARVGGSPLPVRLSVFGPTRLSATHLRVLGALARDRDVHLWVPHPSAPLWERLADAAPAGATGAPAPRRAADTTAEVPAHPLLRSLARDVRELQLRLRPLAARDHHHPAAPPPDTLLGRLQDDLRADRPPAASDARPDLPPDDSLQVHACHGPDRQVEVLREVVLGLLERDPTLEPRDVVVMCPDIEGYAPLVTAAFGRPGDEADPAAHPGHRLPVRLADRALVQVNPLLGTVATLLDLADARVTASQLLALAESEPVRRRFRLDDDDLERLRDLVERSGVRWGLDRPHRAAFRLERFAENTWERGLDRLLLGVARDEEDTAGLGSAFPLDDVESADVERVGLLAEFVDRVGEILDGLRGDRPLGAWVATLHAGLDLLVATRPADAWQLTQARSELAEVADSATGDPVLTLADVRSLLADRLRGRPTRANFRTGTLTVATLVPMRSVPHRVVCLLGLDDDVLPRETRADGDDVLARDPRVGERDPAAEDRQLLLDAVTAATERLVVIHSGRDERTNETRPPAAPVAELLDTVDATATVGGGSARDHVVREHRLQPFHPENFRPDRFTGPAPFSFDGTALAGARASIGERHARAGFLDGPLPDRGVEDVALEDLVAYLEHPTRAFLRQRLGLLSRDDVEEPDEALPIELDGLGTWSIGERLLRLRLGGVDAAACRAAERRRGTLPPGRLGDAVLRVVEAKLEPVVTATGRWWSVPGHDRDLTVVLDDGTTVSGTVPGLRDGTITRATYSWVGAKHRLRSWIHLLALTAADPGAGWTSVVVGRGPLRSQGPVSAATARSVLTDLVALRREGLREPLPLFAKTSAAYAEARADDANPTAALRGADRNKWCEQWTKGVPFPGERDEPPHVRIWGSRADLAVVAGGAGPGAGPGAEPTRFGGLAVRLWAPVLAAEQRGRPS